MFDLVYCIVLVCLDLSSSHVDLRVWANLFLAFLRFGHRPDTSIVRIGPLPRMVHDQERSTIKKQHSCAERFHYQEGLLGPQIKQKVTFPREQVFECLCQRFSGP